jgi:hypothetical protein
MIEPAWGQRHPPCVGTAGPLAAWDCSFMTRRSAGASAISISIPISILIPLARHDGPGACDGLERTRLRWRPDGERTALSFSLEMGRKSKVARKVMTL